MKIHAATLIIGLLCAFGAAAQDQSAKYKVEIQNDTKIIHIDEMGIPGTMSVLEIVSMLPEILNRPSNSMFENYDVQLNGFSVGDSKDQFLSQTYLADVSTIVITENSASSYQTNGQGGSINFNLHKVKQGVSGKLNVDASTDGEAQPTVQFNLKKDKFQIYAWAAYDLYRPTSSLEENVKSDENFIYSADTTWTRQDYQMARLFMDYKPSDNDRLSFQFFETYAKNHFDYSHFERGSHIINESDKSTSSVSLSTNMKYEHKFKASSLSAEARYDYSPATEGVHYGNNRFYDISNWNRGFSGRLDYSQTFNVKGIVKSGNLGLGANFKFSNDTHTRYEEFFPGFSQPMITSVDMSANSSFISPYVNTEWAIGNWRLKLSAEYQCYKYSIKEAKEDFFDKHINDFTGKLVIGWQMAEHHHLRFIVDRKIRRPNDFQIYPYTLYDSGSRSNYKGNPDLEPERSHEFGLDYITDHTGKDGDFFMVNVNASYQHVDGIIGTKFDPGSIYEGEYKLYTNNGENNIYKASAMVLYSVGRLKLSLTGNVFNNNTFINGNSDHFTYYTLGFLPSLGFADNWSLTASGVYSSPVYTKLAELGQSAYATLRLSKSWQKIVLSFNTLLPLSAKATDLSIDNDFNFSAKRYQPYHGYAGISFSFQF